MKASECHLPSKRILVSESHAAAWEAAPILKL